MISLTDYPAFRIARYVALHLREQVWKLIMPARATLHPGHQLRETAHRLLGGGNTRVHTELVETNWVSVLTPEQQRTLHLIAEESLTNVFCHANAQNVWLMLRCTATGMSLAIRDDGRGFDLDKSASGAGLQRIRQWAAGMDAALHIGSKPGYGTSIRVECPARPKNPADVSLPTASRLAAV